MHSADSRGRKHPEPEHPYRGPFQRDRDRIVHSSAFRRLSGKMQVFTGDMGDYHRTRLTHTHEVASIARTIGRALRLNEDLIEALALFHDIGHPPFGHAGEDALDECLTEHGGFSHNRFALTIAEELEIPLSGVSRAEPDARSARRPGDAGRQGRGLCRAEVAPLLEVQVVEAADSMTYDAHDTDDAVKLRLVTLDELAANCAGPRGAGQRAQRSMPNLRRRPAAQGRRASAHRPASDRRAATHRPARWPTGEPMTAQEVRRIGRSHRPSAASWPSRSASWSGFSTTASIAIRG